MTFLGWRDVPVNPDAIGVLAAQVDAPHPPVLRAAPARASTTSTHFELKLFVLRKVDRSTRSSTTDMPDKDDFYVCSLSSRTLVYKGLLVADQIEPFYHDLSHESMVSAFALVHSRFSTNTLGTWKLAHPYRFVVHNGEINTLRGNINWMAARETMFASPDLGDDVKKLLPIIAASGQSDTATLRQRARAAAGHRPLAAARDADADPGGLGRPHPDGPGQARLLRVPLGLMEPWDGPALIIGTDGTQVCAILDRNGLRPCRYLVTTDDLLVMASETGVLDVPPENVLFKRRIQPGRMFLLDTKDGTPDRRRRDQAGAGRSQALRAVAQGAARPAQRAAGAGAASPASTTIRCSRARRPSATPTRTST